MAMDIRKIKKLIELLEESNLVELEIREGEETVRLSRWPKNMPMATMAPQMAPMQVFSNAPQAAPVATASAAAAAAAEPAHDGQVVRSPMVGTYYAAASPGAAPFLKIGQQVKVVLRFIHSFETSSNPEPNTLEWVITVTRLLAGRPTTRRRLAKS